MADTNLNCSFCGKSANEVKKLIAGDNIYICNECVDKCHSILNESTPAKIKNTKAIAGSKNIPGPREIKEFLDQYVIGQDNAKEVLSVAVYNHYKRLENPVINGVEIDKGNVLILGPSGSGKTLLLQTIARMLDVPFVMTDATSLTEAGYVGEDVESIITKLLVASYNDVKKCERGIIFLDEIDKKNSRSGSPTSRDVSGEGVQQALLKIFEGSEIMVPASSGKKGPGTEMVKINTKNILFIVGGAFVGLDKIVDASINDKASIGFGAKIKATKFSEMLDKIEPQHLISFGLIPELVGRLPIIAALDELSETQLVQVLTEPKNALVKQYKEMFGLDGILLDFDEDAIAAIAKIARNRKTGGRALRNVIESKLMRTQFMLPDLKKHGAKKVVVHVSTFNSNEMPEIIYEEQILNTAD